MLLNLIIAFFLEALFGVPAFRAHPVRLIGSLLSVFERAFYPLRWKLLGGVLLVFSSIATVFIVTVVLSLAGRFVVLPFSIDVLTVAMLYFLFCNREMVGEASPPCPCGRGPGTGAGAGVPDRGSGHRLPR